MSVDPVIHFFCGITIRFTTWHVGVLCNPLFLWHQHTLNDVTYRYIVCALETLSERVRVRAHARARTREKMVNAIVVCFEDLFAMRICLLISIEVVCPFNPPPLSASIQIQPHMIRTVAVVNMTVTLNAGRAPDGGAGILCVYVCVCVCLWVCTCSKDIFEKKEPVLCAHKICNISFEKEQSI